MITADVRTGHRRRTNLPARTLTPRWVRPALLVLLLATAVLYLWALGSAGWANNYYAAAVQAGTRTGRRGCSVRSTRIITRYVNDYRNSSFIEVFRNQVPDRAAAEGFFKLRQKQVFLIDLGTHGQIRLQRPTRLVVERDDPILATLAMDPQHADIALIPADTGGERDI